MKYTKRRLNDFNIQGYPPAQHRLHHLVFREVGRVQHLG